MQTVEEIRELLRSANGEELAVLERALRADSRKGVKTALAAARRRVAAQEAELSRVRRLYEFQAGISGGGTVLGLDEVGRGPLAGPLAVGGAVLPDEPVIAGLDDSKRVPEARRPHIAEEVRAHARAWTVVYVEPGEIDEIGMAASLRKAFGRAIADIESRGLLIDRILLDGNPLHLDEREVSIVKGDARCAAIAAASILAKVERDARMRAYARDYPGYGFERNKGYGSAEHLAAIAQHGLTPIHRRSFCRSYVQPALF